MPPTTRMRPVSVGPAAWNGFGSTSANSGCASYGAGLGTLSVAVHATTFALTRSCGQHASSRGAAHGLGIVEGEGRESKEDGEDPRPVCPSYAEEHCYSMCGSLMVRGEERVSLTRRGRRSSGARWLPRARDLAGPKRARSAACSGVRPGCGEGEWWGGEGGCGGRGSAALGCSGGVHSLLSRGRGVLMLLLNPRCAWMRMESIGGDSAGGGGEGREYLTFDAADTARSPFRPGWRHPGRPVPGLQITRLPPLDPRHRRRALQDPIVALLARADHSFPTTARLFPQQPPSEITDPALPTPNDTPPPPPAWRRTAGQHTGPGSPRPRHPLARG